MSADTFALLIPETVLVVGALVIYLAGTAVANRVVWSAAAVVVVLAAMASLVAWPGPTSQPPGPLAADSFALVGRWLALGVGLLFVLIGARNTDTQAPEFFGTLLLLIAGMMVVSAARDLVLLFLGLELISIPTYVLLYMARHGHGRDYGGEEAAAKYFFLSVLSSAIFLFGVSLLYGATGSLVLHEIHDALVAGHSATAGAAMTAGAQMTLARLALLFIVVGLGFKIAAVPFHFYAPDVYQGTSNTAAGLLSVAPKIAGILALVRLVCYALPELEWYAWRIFVLLALLTMTVGNTLALRQTHLRRLLAYSSIAHAGYMLIGLAVAVGLHLGTAAGGRPPAIDPIAAVLFYLVAYCIATLGVFAALVWLGSEQRSVDQVDDLGGLGFLKPVPAIALVVCLFSLAGMPPLMGFWGKFGLFFAAVELDPIGPQGATIRWWALALAVVGVINAAIAAAYYLRIIGRLYLGRAPAAPLPAQGGAGALLATMGCAIATVMIGLAPGPLTDAAQSASRSGRASITQSTPAVAHQAAPKPPSLASDLATRPPATE